MTATAPTTCSDASDVLRNELRNDGCDCSWLEAQLSNLKPAAVGTSKTLPTVFALAGRKFGSQLLTLGQTGHARLREFGLLQASWSHKQAARACLLLAFAHALPTSDSERVVRELFYTGDSDERVVVLRCLPLLPTADQHELLATDAVRSHVQDVFEAIACENPYPERFFTDLAFNQLVMKAYFTGIAVHRIVGLAQRRNAELTRMALDFAAERRAASRPVPADLDLVTTAHVASEVT